MAETPKKPLSVKEFAKVRSMSAKTVSKLCHEGKIPDAEDWGVKKRAIFMIPENAEIKKVSEEMPKFVPNNVTIPLEGRLEIIDLKAYEKIHLRSFSMSNCKTGQCWNYRYGRIRTRKSKDGKNVSWYVGIRVDRDYYLRVMPKPKDLSKIGKFPMIEKVFPHVKDRREAILELEKIHNEYLENRYNKEKTVTFEELAHKYLSYAEGVDKKSIGSDISYLKQKGGLIDYFGRMLVHEISSFNVGEYKKLRKNGRITNTTNLHLSLLRRILNLAKKWKIKLGDEVENIISPKEHFDKVPERHRNLADEEERKLYPNLSEKLQLIVDIALSTGMRKMEILSSEDMNIDLDKREVTITVEKSKTNKLRIIPLNDKAFNAFQILIDSDRSNSYLFPNPNSKTGYITDIQKQFKRALKKAGIEDFHFHDLRHTFATRLLHNGVNVYEIMLLLGHSDLKTTLRYLGLRDERDLSSAVKTLDKGIEKESVETGCNGRSMTVLENIVSPSQSIS